MGQVISCPTYRENTSTHRGPIGHTLWREHVYGFVAYEADKAVSTATAIVIEDCLFLFLVATAPDVRRKGYGEAKPREAAETCLHQTCSAKMGRGSMSVVDGNLKVYGVDKVPIG